MRPGGGSQSVLQKWFSSGVFERAWSGSGGWSAAGQAAVGGDPDQGALYRPAARQHTEAHLAFGFANDIHDDAQDTSYPSKPSRTSSDTRAPR